MPTSKDTTDTKTGEQVAEGKRLSKDGTDIRLWDSIRPYLPKDGWLGEYIHFGDGLEACPRFRFFSACCALGAAINNKIWVQRGDEGLLPKLFPNPWVVLLSPPQRGHKTSTINMAVNCLTQAYDDIRILSDKITPEAIVNALSMPQHPKEVIRIGPRDATGLIKAPELSVFFGKQQYNVGLVSLITDLYDYRETWQSETVGRGKNTLKNNCISVLGGSTPNWLQQMLPQDAFTGGFMSRFILVEMPPNWYKRDPHPKKRQEVNWKHLVEGMKEFKKFKGRMEWAVGAKDVYAEYYMNFTPTGDVQLDAYRERETEQILKIAMILDLNKDKFELTGESLLQAKDLLRSLEEEVSPRIERLTTHPRMHLTQEIQDVLRLYGKLDENSLLKKVYRFLSLGEHQFYESLSLLRKTGVLGYEGKPGTYVYYLKDRSQR